jgi:hypothetical protein
MHWLLLPLKMSSYATATTTTTTSIATVLTHLAAAETRPLAVKIKIYTKTPYILYSTRCVCQSS